MKCGLLSCWTFAKSTRPHQINLHTETPQGYLHLTLCLRHHNLLTAKRVRRQTIHLIMFIKLSTKCIIELTRFQISINNTIINKDTRIMVASIQIYHTNLPNQEHLDIIIDLKNKKKDLHNILKQ